jgi:hypothetical protein
MNVLIDSLILKTLNRVLDIELTYRVTIFFFKLEKQFISSFQIHLSCVFTSWKIFYQLLFQFLFLHECVNRFIDFKDFLLDIELKYGVTKNLFKRLKQFISFQIH